MREKIEWNLGSNKLAHLECCKMLLKRNPRESVIMLLDRAKAFLAFGQFTGLSIDECEDILLELLHQKREKRYGPSHRPLSWERPRFQSRGVGKGRCDVNHYRIKYRDRDDNGCPLFVMTIRASSREEALDKFFDPNDPYWTVVSIEKVK